MQCIVILANIFTFWQTLPRTWYVDEQIKRHMYLIHRRFPFSLSPQGGVWWCSFSSLKQYVALLGPGLSPQMLFSFAFSRDLLSLFLFFVVYGLELGSSLQGKTWRYFMVKVWVSAVVQWEICESGNQCESPGVDSAVWQKVQWCHGAPFDWRNHGRGMCTEHCTTQCTVHIMLHCVNAKCFTVIGGNIYKRTIIVVQNTNPGYYYPVVRLRAQDKIYGQGKYDTKLNRKLITWVWRHCTAVTAVHSKIGYSMCKCKCNNCSAVQCSV